MREAGRLVGEVLTELAAKVAPGVTTAELDALAEKRILRAGATPAFKGYHGYPATICASINDEVIHGIPSGRRVLNEGDIVSIDVGASLDGYFGDSAMTLPVGQVSEGAAMLLRVTEEALYKAIERVRPGGRVSDIGYEVQRHVEAYGFSVVREFVGHGIGQRMHEEPQVPNYGEAGTRATAGRGHGPGDRADGECREGRGQGAGGWLDGGDARQEPVGALRAHGRGDGGRAVDSDGAGSTRRGADVAGAVVEQLPSGLYRVRLDDGPHVTAHIADRVDRNFIRVLVGDRVRIELSPVDVGRGRIVEKIQ